MSILNHRTIVLEPEFKDLEEFMQSIPDLFRDNKGTVIHKGRNELRRIEYKGTEYVIKAFHRPNIINRLVYGVLRPSKAKRSYFYANIYREIGVGTPAPVGYMNIRKGLLFDRSYYVTLASTCPYRYEDLFTHKFSYADDVLRAIGRTTALLHDHGYAHKDYGRANILFDQLPDGSIKIEIVDLNRMAVGPVNLKTGCKNFERLPATSEMHRIMAEAYAEARGFDAQKCFELMEAYRSVQPGKIDGLY